MNKKLSCVLFPVLTILTCGAVGVNGEVDTSHSLLSAVLGWFRGGESRFAGAVGANIHSLGDTSAQPPPRYIAGAGVEPHPSMRHDAMMMHRSEADLIASYLKKTDTYLEWGMGGSTVSFVPLVKRAYSIEHDCEWRDFMMRQLNQSQIDYSHLTAVCASVPLGTGGWGTISSFEHAQYRGPFENYVDTVARLRVPKFDAVLVDGRARMGCALRALEFMHEESVLFVHDFFTRNMHYGGVLEYFDEVARVLAFENNDPRFGPVDDPQGLIVLRRKPGAPERLTAQQINAKYDAVPWRRPYGQPLNSLTGFLDYYVFACFNLSRWRRARNPEKLVWNVRLDQLRIAVLYALVVLFRRFRRNGLLKVSKWKHISSSRTKSSRRFGRASVSVSSNPLVASTSISQVRSRNETQEVPKRVVSREPKFVETTATQRAIVRRSHSHAGLP